MSTVLSYHCFYYHLYHKNEKGEEMSSVAWLWKHYHFTCIEQRNEQNRRMYTLSVCVIIITKGYKVWGIGLTPIVHF